MSIKTWFAATLSGAVMTLAACGGQSNQAAAPAASTPSAAPAASVAAPAGGKVLRVGMNAEFAPFESLNTAGQIEGFDVDLLNAMAQAGGFKVEFNHKPWTSLFPALGNGDIDVVASGVTITDERKQSMDFTDPYYQITQVVLVAPGKEVQSIEDLKKLSKVGVVTGNTGDLAAQKIFGATSQTVARFETVPLLIKEVESGGVDAAISDSAVVAHYVKNNEGKGFKMIAVPDFAVENYGIAVRKGDAETLNMLNNALKTIRENGEYAKIESKYFAK